MGSEKNLTSCTTHHNHKICHESPYGCPQSPDLNEFPQLKIDSLPSDPLNKGEQYFVDLAGNIKKGPLNKSNSCYCKPLFEKVEQKMESDKQEIKHHIDSHTHHLKAKIYHLEKKTARLSETFKEKVLTVPNPLIVNPDHNHSHHQHHPPNHHSPLPVSI